MNFAFVSCQDINEGKLNAYRRMIYEDERAAPGEQLDFVLHLGDFIYEVVWYPEDRSTRYDRTIGRIPGGPPFWIARAWEQSLLTTWSSCTPALVTCE